MALCIVLAMYGAQAFLAFSAIADYTNGHRLFPVPSGGYAMAAVVEGGVVVAFLLFRRNPWLAGVMLAIFAGTSYLLQKLHAEEVNHPLLLAGIVPASLVLGGIALHLIKPPKAETAPADPEQTSTRTAMPEPEPAIQELARHKIVTNGAPTGKHLVALIIREEGDPGTEALMARAKVTDRTVREGRRLVKEGS